MLSSLSKSEVGEVDMSRTCAAISDSMLPDDTVEEDGVNATGFLQGLEKTSLGGGTDITMAPDKTVLGGGMEETLELGTPAQERQLGARRRTDLTQLGGGMDLTMAPSLDQTCGGMEQRMEDVEDSVFTPHHQPSVAELPTSLPGSANSSIDCGATATVRFSQLALANNTLLLPRHSSQESEGEEEMTRAPEMIINYDPEGVVSREAVPLAKATRTQSILKQQQQEEPEEADMEMTTVGGGNMEMTRVGDMQPISQEAGMARNKTLGEEETDKTVGGQDMEMTRLGAKNKTVLGTDMEMTSVAPESLVQQRSSRQDVSARNQSVVGRVDMEMTRADGGIGSRNRTVVGGAGMEMTVQGSGQSRTFQDRSTLGGGTMEMTRVEEGQPLVGTVPAMNRSVAASPGDTSEGWETLHSPALTVSPLLPQISTSSRRNEADSLRQQFPSPCTSPSPTRLVSGLPRRPTNQGWEGEVTSFLPRGESTRAVKDILPPPASPMALHSRREVADMTTFAPPEEYESTRKLPALRPASKPMEPSSPGLPLPRVREVADMTTFAPPEEYESTRKLPALTPASKPVEPSSLGLPVPGGQAVGNITSFAPPEESESTRKLPRVELRGPGASLSSLEEVTSPNSAVSRSRRVQATMMQDITAAPGCSCVAWVQDRGPAAGAGGCRVHGGERSPKRSSSEVEGDMEQTMAEETSSPEKRLRMESSVSERLQGLAAGSERTVLGGGMEITMAPEAVMEITMAPEAVMEITMAPEVVMEITMAPEVVVEESCSQHKASGTPARDKTTVVVREMEMTRVEGIAQLQSKVKAVGGGHMEAGREELEVTRTSAGSQIISKEVTVSKDKTVIGGGDMEMTIVGGDQVKNIVDTRDYTETGRKELEVTRTEAGLQSSSKVTTVIREGDMEMTRLEGVHLKSTTMEAGNITEALEVISSGKEALAIRDKNVVDEEDMEEEEVSFRVTGRGGEIKVMEVEVPKELNPASEDAIMMQQEVDQERQVVQEESQGDVIIEEQKSTKVEQTRIQELSIKMEQEEQKKAIANDLKEMDQDAPQVVQAQELEPEKSKLQEQEVTPPVLPISTFATNFSVLTPNINPKPMEQVEAAAAPAQPPPGAAGVEARPEESSLPQSPPISVFSDLASRQSRDPVCPECQGSHGAWRLAAEQRSRQAAAVMLMEGGIMLIIRYEHICLAAPLLDPYLTTLPRWGEPLASKRSRRTGGGVQQQVEHFIVREFEWRSMLPELREDEEDFCIAEAQV